MIKKLLQSKKDFFDQFSVTFVEMQVMCAICWTRHSSIIQVIDPYNEDEIFVCEYCFIGVEKDNEKKWRKSKIGINNPKKIK